METRPTISIIVTAYEIDAYLSECLDSILMQSFTDYELILVDDGSTDNSGIICDEYATLDERIRVIHQKNKGPAGARKAGLDVIRGEYVCIIDGDDVLLTPDYLGTLYKTSIEYDADISICDRVAFAASDDFETVKAEAKREVTDIKVVSGQDVFREETGGISTKRFSFAYAKIYRRKCFSDLDYPDDMNMEAPAVFHYLVYPCKRIAVMDKPMYGWRRHSASILEYGNKARFYKEIYKALDDCIEYLSSRGDEKAVDVAIKRKWSYAITYFNEAIDSGEVVEIPEEIRPGASDWEIAYNHRKIMRLLDTSDPQARYQHTRDLIDNAIDRAVDILSITTSFITGEPKVNGNITCSADTMMDLAKVEGLQLMVSEAMLQTENIDPGTRRICKDHRGVALRRSVLSAYVLNNVEVELKKEGVFAVSFLPAELRSIYPGSLHKEAGNRIMIIAEDSIDTLRSVLKNAGFEEPPKKPLEAMRKGEIEFKNKDGVSVICSIGAPFVMHDECRRYMESLYETLIEEKREMTLQEYAVVLTAKLHDIHVLSCSTTLADILDMAMIIRELPGLKDDIAFTTMLDQLNVMETWEQYSSLCDKLLADTCEINIDENDRKLVERVIRHPEQRMSYMRSSTPVDMNEGGFFQRIEYAVLEDRGIAYLLNSKVACSSLLASMMREDIRDDHSIHRLIRTAGLIRARLREEEEKYFCYTFVRNPFERLVSCYESKYHVDKEKYDNVNDFKGYFGGYLAIDNGFEEFIYRVCSLPHALMDVHFRPQYDLIYREDGTCRCEFIGRFERLEEDYEPIRKRYDLRKLSHLNSSNTINWMDYYTPKTAKLVYEVFEKDVGSFGFGDEYRELMEHLENGKT